MLIIPYVCADFRDKKGNPIFRITADMLRTMQDVPEAIKQDLLFDMLVQDGSIKTPETVAQRKLLEQDPMIGMNADGRSAEKAQSFPGNSDRKISLPGKKWTMRMKFADFDLFKTRRNWYNIIRSTGCLLQSNERT